MAAPKVELPVVDLESLSIGEALEVTNYVKNDPNYTNTIRSSILEAGIDLDAPYNTLANKKQLEAIALDDFIVTGKSKLARRDPYKHLTTIHNSLVEFSADRNQEWTQPDYGEQAVKKFKIVTGKQIRNSKVFKAYPKAEILLPKLTEALQKIDDADVRESLIFNSLVPMRPGEVADLKVGDVNLKTGEVSVLVRGNKTRANIFLPEMALAILNERAKGKKKGDPLFNTGGVANSTFVSKMTTALKDSGFIDAMDEYKPIMGRSITGAADVRKLIPALIAYELGYPDEISEIMGHEDFAELDGVIKKMTKRHYIGSGRMFGKDFEFSTTTALKALQNKWADVLGLNSLNELAVKLGTNTPDFTNSEIKIPVVLEGEDLVDGTKPTAQTPEDIARLEKTRQQRFEEAAAQSELKIAQTEVKRVEAQTKAAQKLIEAESTLVEGAEAQARINEARVQARQRQRQQTEAEARDAEIAKTEAKVTGNPNNMSAARARKDIMDSIKGIGAKVADVYENLPGPVKKVVPIAGTAASLFAAGQKGVQAAEHFEKGEYLSAAGRGLQAVEELASPLPITTSDIEEMEPLPKDLRSGALGVTGQQITQQINALPKRASTEDQMNQLLNR